MKRFIILALAASAAVCLAGCGTTTSADIGQFSAIVQDVAPALQVVVNQDAAVGEIDQATADQVTSYVQVVETAVSAAQAGSAACAGVTQSACALNVLQTAVTAADQLLGNPAVAKLVGETAGPRVQAALSAVKQAVLAAQDVKAASASATQSAKTAAVMAALFQLNLAVLDGIQAAR